MLSPAQHDGSGVDELATWRTRWRPRQVCVSQVEARSPNPSTAGSKARTQVRATDVPYHAPKQEQASAQEHIDQEMGNAHAIVVMLGGPLNDDPDRHSLL